MTQILAVVALSALILSLGSTLLAIWFQAPAKDDLLRLTEILLTWPVIAGGLAFGAGTTFGEQIKGLLVKFSR